MNVEDCVDIAKSNKNAQLCTLNDALTERDFNSRPPSADSPTTPLMLPFMWLLS